MTEPLAQHPTIQQLRSTATTYRNIAQFPGSIAVLAFVTGWFSAFIPFGMSLEIDKYSQQYCNFLKSLSFKCLTGASAVVLTCGVPAAGLYYRAHILEGQAKEIEVPVLRSNARINN